MLDIITGVPGSGKTFYAVKIIRDNYCDYDKLLNKYTVKNNSANGKPYNIVTNIDNLLLPHANLDDAIKTSKMDILKFFTYEYQEKLSNIRPNIVYIIDECQQYFDQKMNSTQTLLFFEKHRHLGIDIVLMAQTYERINKNIRGLEELHIHAVKRTFSVFGEFQYNIKSGYEVIDKRIIKKDKSIFALYQSRLRAELTKAKNPLSKYFLISFIIMIISFLFFYFTFLKKGDEKIVKKKDNSSSAVENNLPPNVTSRIPDKDDDIKYYYRLSIVTIQNNGYTQLYYHDYLLNELLPIEIIKNPIIKVPILDNFKYMVVCNYPSKRYEVVRTYDDDDDDEKIITGKESWE